MHADSFLNKHDKNHNLSDEAQLYNLPQAQAATVSVRSTVFARASVGN